MLQVPTQGIGYWSEGWSLFSKEGGSRGASFHIIMGEKSIDMIIKT